MTTKIQTVAKLISRKSGASIEQLQDATGWQPHSIRAALTGLRKKGVSIKRDAHRTRGSFYKAMKG
ncbi:MAG: DUF3489 domain-containing protein [Rhodospirillaceae bacterium]|jgi:hypothetical protein|nr:DUF3489 domain-containing protein [Rhodospirillaceae bacterium]MBT5243791.1 DUF3489 domain-containing protein [Rhodospirillaceae bacterium]MBT5563888.1 DUF3489 domain-containing protein [Rhodospirillaceae bacterium]MBT7138211.1 DUF3489 domain-containing protein [Rhodospirillaceae bacterium]